MIFPYDIDRQSVRRIGLVVLQADETIELEYRNRFAAEMEMLVTRLPSAPEVSLEGLAAMEAHLTEAVSLFPQGARFDAIGFACTSGAAQIGSQRAASLIGAACHTAAVTDPVEALIAKCRAKGITRLALLSPYVAQVSARLRDVLAAEGIETPVFGSFDVAEEAVVARIDPPSLMAASRDLVAGGEAEALFISCTNLRTASFLDALSAALSLPVFSSNSVLADRLEALSV